MSTSSSAVSGVWLTATFARYEGFHGLPQATCDNTDDVLAIDPRPGNATANCADDNIARSTWPWPGCRGRSGTNVLVRLDGAGFC